LQVELFYRSYGLEWRWFLPDLKWGMKYYFDLPQLLPTGLMALITPLIAMGVKIVTDRIPVARRRPAGVGEEWPDADWCDGVVSVAAESLSERRWSHRDRDTETGWPTCVGSVLMNDLA
jgi:hypothetical protein